MGALTIYTYIYIFDERNPAKTSPVIYKTLANSIVSYVINYQSQLIFHRFLIHQPDLLGGPLPPWRPPGRRWKRDWPGCWGSSEMEPLERSSEMKQIHSRLTYGQWTRNEDVCPIEHGDIPLLCYFTRGYLA